MSGDYTIGRGEFHFDKFAPGTRITTGERYFGNTPDMSLSSDSETLDHFDSDHGIREKDDSVVLQVDRNLTFTADDISDDNLSLWFLSEKQAIAQTALTAQPFTFANITQGVWYQFGRNASRPTGFRDVTDIAITTPASAVAGVDYEVDAALGRFRVLPGSTIIAANSSVTGTHGVAAGSRVQIVSAADAVIEGAGRFISFNPKGTRRDFYWPYLRLTPDGDFALKGDEWQQMSFTAAILKLPGYAQQYIDGRPVIA